VSTSPNSLFGLDGKRAFVAGGGQGIGRSCALLLARAGCDVAVLDLESARAEAVAKEVEAEGRRGLAVAGDALDRADAARVVQEAAASLGGLDVCVNIIGLASWQSFLDLEEETWDKDLLGNLTHHVFIAQPAARIMVEQGTGGAIGMIGSVSGLFAAPDHGAYGAAKAGIFALVRTLAQELASHHIRVNAVAPGSVRTPRIIAMQESGEAPSQQSDLDRMCECDDIGSAILFLCSDLAKKVTGQTLVVDAGVTSKFPFEVS
jgi:NAD(P)-dependent dehydrogenase (short-subunit alcohol dehydrogenase family)